MSWRTHGKSILQLLGALVLAVIFVVQEATSDGSVINPSEWVLVGIAAFGVFQVWGAANIPGFDKAKNLMSAAAAVLGLLVTVITGGIQGQEWMALIVLFLTTLGVVVSPAKKATVAGSTYTDRGYAGGLT